MVMPITDDQSVAEWEHFLSAYSRGDFTQNTPDLPSLPPSLIQLLKSPQRTQYGRDNPHTPLYPSTSIDSQTARAIRDFYCAHGYLPPPRPVIEEIRERCVLEYDLRSPGQLKNIDEAVEILASFFPGALITFSLFYRRVQQYYSFAGPQEYIDLFALYKGMPIPVEDSLCGHAILSDGAPVFIADGKSDWRYRLNPYVLMGMESYIGSPVLLSRDPTKSEQDHIPIGTLNVCFMNRTVHSISSREYQILAYVTKMLQTMLRATWEGNAVTREGRVRRAIGDFLESTLKAVTDDSDTVSQKAAAPLRMRHHQDFIRLAQEAVDVVRSILPEVESLILIDLRDVVATRADSDLRYMINKTRLPLQVAQSGISLTPLSANHIVHCLLRSAQNSEGFYLSEHPSPTLNHADPVPFQSHLALPFSNGDPPVFMFYAVSHRRLFPQQATLVQMLRSMGSVLRAKVLQNQATELDASKTAFLSAISHELRTPLHNILLAFDLLNDKSVTIDDVLPDLTYSTHVLQTILNNILEYGTKSIEQTKDSHVSRLHLLDTVRNAAKMCARQHLPPDSTTTVQMLHDGAEVSVHMDEAKLQRQAVLRRCVADARVLINGLSNAMKSCSDGTITIDVSAHSTDRSDLLISIADTGIGMTPEVLKRIFAPFVKGDDAKPGAGLGLHITERLVTSMGGQIEVESEIGKGTKFTVKFPKAVAPDQPGPTGSKVLETIIEKTPTSAVSSRSPHDLEPASGLTPSFDQDLDTTRDPVLLHAEDAIELPVADLSVSGPQELRILVVDDNAICLKLLKTALSRSDVALTIREAKDGLEAIAMYKRFRPHLVITDISMPLMDGITAAERMREYDGAERRSRIYALTGLGSSDPRTKMLGLDGHAALDGWLTKGKDQAKMILAIIGELSGVGRPEG